MATTAVLTQSRNITLTMSSHSSWHGTAFTFLGIDARGNSIEWDSDGTVRVVETAAERDVRLAVERAAVHRRHPLRAMMDHIFAGDIPLPWIMGTCPDDAALARLWARARLIDREGLLMEVDKRRAMMVRKWARRIARGEATAHRDALGWIYRRHVPPPTLSQCIDAARARRTTWRVE